MENSVFTKTSIFRWLGVLATLVGATVGFIFYLNADLGRHSSLLLDDLHTTRQQHFKNQSAAKNDGYTILSKRKELKLAPTSSKLLFIKRNVSRLSRGYSFESLDLSDYISIPNKKPLSLSCASCALVTNSGHLIDSGMGAEIDEQECVFRLNNAPVSTHEADIGRRTTVRMVGHPSWSKIKNDKITILVGPQKPTHVIVWGPFIPLNRAHLEKDISDFVAKYNYPDIKFFYMSFQQLEQNARIFERETGLLLKKETTGVYMSTGFVSFVLSMSVCHNLTIYGMPDENQCRKMNDVSSKRNTSTSVYSRDGSLTPGRSFKNTIREKQVPYHYWESYGVKECTHYLGCQYSSIGHRFYNEKMMIRRWAMLSRKINFKSPKWDLKKPVRPFSSSNMEKRKMGKFGSCWGR